MPEDVVREAHDLKSPLHGHFDWDDTAAAHNWRIEQARRLLRVTVEFITVKGVNIPMRVFCSLSADQSEEGGYRATVDVISDEGWRKVLLADAMRDIDIFTERYSQLKELAKVISAMRETVAVLTTGRRARHGKARRVLNR